MSFSKNLAVLMVVSQKVASTRGLVVVVVSWRVTIGRVDLPSLVPTSNDRDKINAITTRQ
jgi:hypothetical protein